MRIMYNKLVRDRIPDIIRQSGRECGTAILALEDYRDALLAKLVEEANELATAKEDELVTEIGDVYEVLEMIVEAFNVSPETVRSTKALRQRERGGFRERIKLLWTEG